MIRVMVVVAQLLLAGCASLMPDDKAERAEQRVEVYTQLGLGYMSQNRLASAQESLDEALAVNPKYSPANHAMALLMLRLGDPAGADKYFVSALESDPRNVAARNDYGAFLCDLEKWQEGAFHLEKALLDPFNTEVYVSQFGLGKCFLKAGDPVAARDQFRLALAAQPNNGAILYQSAVASFTLGEYLSSRAFLERFFAVVPATAEGLLLAARTETKLGATDLAKEYAARLREDFPASEQAAELQNIPTLNSNG